MFSKLEFSFGRAGRWAIIAILATLCFPTLSSAQQPWTFLPTTGATPGGGTGGVLAHNLSYTAAVTGDYLNDPPAEIYSPAATSSETYWTDPEHLFNIELSGYTASVVDYKAVPAKGGITVLATDNNVGVWQWTGTGNPPAMQEFAIKPTITLKSTLGSGFTADLSVGDTIGDDWNITSGAVLTQPSTQLIYVPVTTNSGGSTATINIQTLYGLWLQNDGLSSSGEGTATAFESFSATPDSRTVVASAGTSAKTPELDTDLLDDDDNPNWPYICDQYGNQYYQPGQEANGGGDVGLPVGSNTGTTSLTCVASALGPWNVNGSKYNWLSVIHGQSQSDTLESGDGIPPFTVNYQDPVAFTVTDPEGMTNDVYYPNDLDPAVDQITITYTDGSDGASATAKLNIALHPAIDSYQLSGPTSASDPNMFSYETTALSWPNGVAPSNFNQSFPISYSHGFASWAPYVLNGVGVAFQYLSAALVEQPEWDSITEAAGLSATQIAGTINDQGSISEQSLWPGTSTAPYPNQWSNTGTPEQSPTCTGPSDWQPGETISQITDTPTCVPYMMDQYENLLIGTDNWSDSGYESYAENYVGTFHTAVTFGLWTWTTNGSGTGKGGS